MILTLSRVNNVHRPIAALETILDKRKQYAILLFFAVEKRTDVTRFVELGACKRNGGRGLHKYSPPPPGQSGRPFSHSSIIRRTCSGLFSNTRKQRRVMDFFRGTGQRD